MMNLEDERAKMRTKRQWKRKTRMQRKGENQRELSMKEENEDNLRERWMSETEPCHKMYSDY